MRTVSIAPERHFQIALIALLALALTAVALKGANVDEFWTIAFADSRVPWHTAFEVWTKDSGHPVGFYFWNRLLDPVLPGTVAAGRAANLAFVAALVLGARTARKDGFAWLFVFALLAQPYIIERFAEYRATFSALMCISIVVICIRDDWFDDRVSRRSAIAGLSLAGAMLLDYPVGLAGVATCSGCGAMALIDRRYRQAATAAGLGATGLLVMLLGLLNTARYPVLAPPYTQDMVGFFKDTTVILLTAIAPLALPLAISRIPHFRASQDDPISGEKAFVAMMAFTLLVVIAGYTLLNLINHGMIRRQLIGYVPICTALLCALLWHAVTGPQRFVRLLALGCPLAVAAAVPYWLSLKTGFDTFGGRLAAAQRGCSTLPIYGVRPSVIDNTVSEYRFAGIADPVDLGLPLTAKSHGFHLSPTPRKVDPKCGAIIWSEFMWNPAPTPQVVAARVALDATPAMLANSQVLSEDHSYALIIPPAKR